MKKTLMIAIATMALAGLLLATATTATATPGRATACSNCHSTRAAVHLKVTRVSSTATTVTYKVAVTGGSGKAAWAVLSGGKNLAHKTASTGTFKVAKKKTIKVFGVKKGTGSTNKTIAVK
jgi:hypothetical protein